MILLPKFRIARVPVTLPSKERRALPVYLEMRWLRWRKVIWLGRRIYENQANWG